MTATLLASSPVRAASPDRRARPAPAKRIGAAQVAARADEWGCRARPVSWAQTELTREAVLDLVTGLPFAAFERHSLARRLTGTATLLDWLATQPGGTWQQRWLTGADELVTTWTDPGVAVLGARGLAASTARSHLHRGALSLLCAQVVRPSLAWLIGNRFHRALIELEHCLDPMGFARLAEHCAASGQIRQGHQRRAFNRIAWILANKGGTIADITVGDCLQLQQAMTDTQGSKGTGKHLYYLLLRDTGVLGPGVPANLQAMLMPGQLSVEELVDRHEIAHAGIRGVFVEYFRERQPVMDYGSLSGRVRQLCGLFWRDLEIHHPGIASLALAPEIAYAWKQRIKTCRGADGIARGRTTAPDVMIAVRGFYADLQMWAVEDPARWAAWVAPNPIRAADTDLTKSKLHRKARTDERTRRRLPLLPQLVNALDERRRAAQARLRAVRDQPPGSTVELGGQRLHRAKLTSHAYAGQIYVTDADTNQRRNLSHEESDAFWSWAIVEILRHTGIRLEELTELTHHSLIAYKLPSTGEVVPMLQIAPSKVDRERLILVSPELAEVIAEVIHRVRDGRAVLPLVCQYDIHEKKTSPPMPFLLQRPIGGQHRAIRRGTITGILARAVQAVGPTGSDNQPVRYSPHDFRRLFVTDAILNGLPPHIAQVICGHLDLSTTMTYKATYPTETIESYRAHITRRRATRPSEEYRTPTDEEWDSFLAHFEKRIVSVGTCARAFGTPCIHEHACVRCSLLRPNPTQRARLHEIRDNLQARIVEANREGWLGEVEGLQVSLAGAKDKIAQIDATVRRQAAVTELGMPSFAQVAGRASTVEH